MAEFIPILMKALDETESGVFPGVFQIFYAGPAKFLKDIKKERVLLKFFTQMPYLTKERVLERFRHDATNSSHFVWLLADLKFYETKEKWLFAFLQVGSVTLIPLEPMVPGAPTKYLPKHSEAFLEAWSEFEKEAQVKTAAFVSIYAEFLPLIKNAGFGVLKVGEEPLVELKNCIPTGNSGKGVRAARNQALRAGLVVEEWFPSDLLAESKKRRTIEEIKKEWGDQRLFRLEGFLNSTDPFAYKEDRRYFVLFSKIRAEAYLIVTPIPGTKNYFLEDLVLRKNTPRGTGEMLTLEALVALRVAGGENASLGVVSLTTIDAKSDIVFSNSLHFLLITLPHLLRKIYNFDGLALFRRRFKPHEWKSVYLAVRPEIQSKTSRAWMHVFIALAIAFRPQFRMHWKWPFGFTFGLLNKYRVTTSVAAVSFILFSTLNRFGTLPDEVLANWGFSIGAPFKEWISRTLISNFLYFDAFHFWTWGSAFLFTLAWTERTHGNKFTLRLLLLSSLFADIVHYLLILKPFQYYRPHLFQGITDYKDVGSSLLFMTFLGVQICQFKRIREFLFVGLSFSLIFKFSLEAKYMEWFMFNLNHILFLSVGFCIGKVDFQLSRSKMRRESRKVSRGKPLLTHSIVQMPNPRGAR